MIQADECLKLIELLEYATLQMNSVTKSKITEGTDVTIALPGGSINMAEYNYTKEEQREYDKWENRIDKLRKGIDTYFQVLD